MTISDCRHRRGRLENYGEGLRKYYSNQRTRFIKYWFKGRIKANRVDTSKKTKKTRKEKKKRKKALPLPRRLRVSLAELQRMHLRKLQVKLAKNAVDMRYDELEPPDWEKNLQDYSNSPPFLIARHE
jgi:hypothetical protein